MTGPIDPFPGLLFFAVVLAIAAACGLVWWCIKTWKMLRRYGR